MKLHPPGSTFSCGCFSGRKLLEPNKACANPHLPRRLICINSNSNIICCRVHTSLIEHKGEPDLGTCSCIPHALNLWYGLVHQYSPYFLEEYTTIMQPPFFFYFPFSSLSFFLFTFHFFVIFSFILFLCFFSHFLFFSFFCEKKGESFSKAMIVQLAPRQIHIYTMFLYMDEIPPKAMAPSSSSIEEFTSWQRPQSSKG